MDIISVYNVKRGHVSVYYTVQSGHVSVYYTVQSGHVSVFYSVQSGHVSVYYSVQSGHVCRMDGGSHSFTDSLCTRHTFAPLPSHHHQSYLTT